MRIAALIIALLLAVAFAVQNTAVVSVSLLLWKVQAPFAVVMVLCVAFGFLTGLLAVASSFLKGRRHARSLERQLAKLNAIDPDTSATVRHSARINTPVDTAPPRPTG